MITFDDFKKIEIRIGTILEVTKVPETDRLLKLLIDLGSEKRSIISGIANFYPDPSILVGKQVPVLTNLEGRVIKGEESNGMVLYALEEDGILTTLSPATPIKDGSIVR